MVSAMNCNATHTLSGVAGFSFRSIQGGMVVIVVIAPGPCMLEAIEIDDIGRDGFVGGAIVTFFSSISS